MTEIQENTFDVIIIGSSPILLIEALYLDSTGLKVALFEKKSRVGGAWYPESLWGISSVETGCHYIDRGKKNYNFLQKFLNIELQPQPRHVLWKDTNGNGHNPRSGVKARVQNSLEVLFKNKLIRRDLWDVYNNGRKGRIKKALFSLTNLLKSQPFLYPLHGCKSIVDELETKIDNSSVRLFKSADVKSVHIVEKGSRNRCQVGTQNFTAKRIVVSQNVSVDIFMNDTSFLVEQEMHPYTHLVLRINGKKRPDFNYIDVIQNPMLRRVQDVTSYADFGSNSDSSDLLICCHLVPGYAEKELQANEIFSQLIELELLSDDSELLDHHLDHYVATLCVENKKLFELESSLPEELTIMRTWDLGISLEYYSDRWASLLANTPINLS